jgi:hypothetical protein
MREKQKYLMKYASGSLSICTELFFSCSETICAKGTCFCHRRPDKSLVLSSLSPSEGYLTHQCPFCHAFYSFIHFVTNIHSISHYYPNISEPAFHKAKTRCPLIAMRILYTFVIKIHFSGLWSECVFPNSYVEILIPKMMI